MLAGTLATAQEEEAMAFREQDLGCAFCHAEDYEVIRSETRGFVVLCNECGYAQGATLEHLLAS